MALTDPIGIRYRGVAGYVLAAIAVAVTAMIRFLLEPVLGLQEHYLFFTAAVLVSAVFGGRGAGLFATILSALASLIVFEMPLASGRHLAALSAFIVVSGGQILLASNLIKWREAAEASAREARGHAEELGLLIDGATNYAIYMLDTDGHVVHWNKGAERIKGWREDDVIGRHVAMFYTPYDIARGIPDQHLERARQAGTIDEEVDNVRRDGTVYRAQLAITALRDEAGRLRGFAKVVRDVTSERAAERAIELQEMQLRSVLATVPDAMVVTDSEGVIESFSATAEAMFGYEEKDILGRNVAILMPEPNRKASEGHAFARRIDKNVLRSLTVSRRLVARRRDGSTLPIELTVGEAIAGGRTLLTGFIRDLTQQEATRRELEALQLELLHGSRLSAMGTMASTLAHELNQPMTAVANYIEGCRLLLARVPGVEGRRLDDALAAASSEAVRAGEIVSHLREFVARGEITLAIESLDDLVLSAVRLMSASIERAAVELKLNISADAGPVFADRVQIQQVLVNLVRNAVEAMRGRPVRQLVISAHREGDRLAHVIVEDSGEGLQPEVANRLFQAFVSSKQNGLGVGLSICRTIVEAHGGHIWVESSNGGGARFHFTLSRKLEEASHAA
jgi:two-component system, LuxR family, sensor kinase FixL